MKGIFYSIMIALILIPILSLVVFHSQIKTENVDISIRANELNYFIESLETDLNKFAEIGGKRALISAVSEVVTIGVSLDDAEAAIAEMVEYGTKDGNPAPLVDTNNLQIWEDDVKNIAQNSGFEIDFTTLDISITQNNSFEILLTINLTFNISDPDASMGIVRNITGISIISIENIEDPLFPLKSYGRVTRIIKNSNTSKKTEYLVGGTNSSGFVSGDAFVINSSDLTTGYSDKILVTDTIAGKEAIAAVFKGVVSEGDTLIPPEIWGKAITGASGARQKITNNTKIYLDETTKKVWDLSNLTSDLTNGYYHNSSVGASFLDRLEGNTTLSPKYKYGLETFINLEEFSIAGIPVGTTYSCLDHRYWNDIEGNEIRNGNYDPVFNWFKIDTLYADDYGIDELD
jgi:hypothetical protein